MFLVQFIKCMPPAYFKPMGARFIAAYNVKYNIQVNRDSILFFRNLLQTLFQPPWDPNEFGEYCFGYLVFLCAATMHNFSHPGFHRTAPPQLQVTTAMAAALQVE